MFDSLFYLCGDSYPRKPHVEQALFGRLASLSSERIGQGDLLRLAGADGFTTDVPQRLAMLDRVLPAGERAQRTVLIGRSSGARVASLFAMQRQVAAVVCLGYPFREPDRLLEPERFIHLAHTPTPTLIVQGVADPYGGIDLTEDYGLSPAVTLSFFDVQHDFDLPPSGWDAVAERISAFCGDIAAYRKAGQDPFDEDFYLRTHPGVADAVASGGFLSGEDHYRKHGAEERRTFRIKPRIGG
jgi:pimeloyl-ACP methyl ester carboxylesterase